MSTRDALLDVTARLYADHGWRGTTTRRIAEAAGVNEVTIFRQFGSKEALLLEAIQATSTDTPPAPLPVTPRRVRAELTAWALAQHASISARRGVMRSCLAELDERPELAPTLCEGGVAAFADCSRYLDAARESDLLGHCGAIEPATVMLMNAVFMDAMTRDIMPPHHPLSVPQVIAMFVDLILRALGAPESA
ncbi:MAG: helix-turn-helix domain-containing protein [Gemmatimonadales bacterium]